MTRAWLRRITPLGALFHPLEHAPVHDESDGLDEEGTAGNAGGEIL